MILNCFGHDKQRRQRYSSHKRAFLSHKTTTTLLAPRRRRETSFTRPHRRRRVKFHFVLLPPSFSYREAIISNISLTYSHPITQFPPYHHSCSFTMADSAREDSGRADSVSQGDLAAGSVVHNNDRISRLTHQNNLIVSDTIIDRYGDLILEVGQDKVSFAVCSKTMARASPFWRALLYGGFAESMKPATGPWIVKLPEDDPDALRVFLNILHGQFSLMPMAMSAKHLAEITSLGNKYDMLPLLAPFAKTWIDWVGSPKCWWSDLTPLVEHLIFSYHLGFAERFEYCTGRIAWQCKMNYGELGVHGTSDYYSLSECPLVQQLDILGKHLPLRSNAI